MIHDNIHRSKTTITSTFNICESHNTCIVYNMCGNIFRPGINTSSRQSNAPFFPTLTIYRFANVLPVLFFISLFFVILSLSPFVWVCVCVSWCVCLDKTRTPPSITNATATGAAVAVACYGCRCQCNADIINFTVKHDGFHVPHPTPGIGYVCVCAWEFVCLYACFFCALFSVRHLCFWVFFLSILPFVCHFRYNYCRFIMVRVPLASLQQANWKIVDEMERAHHILNKVWQAQTHHIIHV